MSFTPISVQATRVNPDGSPAAGNITFTLNAEMLNGTLNVQPIPTLGVMNDAGQLVGQSLLALPLLANDDEGTTPSSPTASYLVAENLDGSNPVTYSVIIEHTATITDNAAVFTVDSPVVTLSNVIAAASMVGQNLIDATNFPSGVEITAYDPTQNTLTLASTATSTVTESATIGGAVDLATLAQYEPAPEVVTYIPFTLDPAQTNGQVPVWNATDKRWEPGNGGGGGSFPTFTGSGSPEGVQTATAVGQSYVDSTNGALYFYNGTPPSNTGWLAANVIPLDGETPAVAGFWADLFDGYLAIVGDGSTAASPTITDLLALAGTFNGIFYQTTGTDGEQHIYLQLGSSGQFPWYFNADGTTQFPGAVQLTGGASLFSYYGDPNGNVTALATGDFCVDTFDLSLWMATDAGTNWIKVAGKQILSLTYNNQAFDVPVSSLPAGWSGSGVATMAAQLTTGPSLVSGLLDSYGNPIPDGFTFPATIFVEGTEIYDIVAQNGYIYGNPGQTGYSWWGASGGTPLANIGPNALIIQNLPTTDPEIAGAFWNYNGQIVASGFTPTAPPGASIVRAFPFAFDTPDILTGAALYTPTVGDILLDAWIEIDTAWDGTTPKGDFGAFTESPAHGLFGALGGGGIDMTVTDSTINGNDGLLASSNHPTNPTSLSASCIAEGFPATVAPVRQQIKFTAANPVLIVVSQDGTNTGADPGSTVGSGILYLVMATPA